MIKPKAVNYNRTGKYIEYANSLSDATIKLDRTSIPFGSRKRYLSELEEAVRDNIRSNLGGRSKEGRQAFNGIWGGLLYDNPKSVMDIARSLGVGVDFCLRGIDSEVINQFLLARIDDYQKAVFDSFPEMYKPDLAGFLRGKENKYREDIIRFRALADLVNSGKRYLILDKESGEEANRQFSGIIAESKFLVSSVDALLGERKELENRLKPFGEGKKSNPSTENYNEFASYFILAVRQISKDIVCEDTGIGNAVKRAKEFTIYLANIYAARVNGAYLAAFKKDGGSNGNSQFNPEEMSRIINDNLEGLKHTASSAVKKWLQGLGITT